MNVQSTFSSFVQRPYLQNELLQHCQSKPVAFKLLLVHMAHALQGL